jgi:hypothetical protein
MSRASTQDLLDGEIAVPDNRGVTRRAPAG